MGKFVTKRGLSALDPEAQVEVRARLLLCTDYFNIKKGEFAEALGAERKTSSGWFGKEAKTPELQTLLNLAHDFGVSLHWLLLGEGGMIRRSKDAIAAAKRMREAGKRRVAKRRARVRSSNQ